MMLDKCLLLLTLIAVLSVDQTDAQNRSEEVTHYIFSDFIEGMVLMKNGRKNEVSINYNSISEEMIFKKGDLKLAIGNTESELIDTIYMNNRKFIRLDGKFVEILYLSPEVGLFVQYKCRLHAPGKYVGFGGTSETAAVDNYSSIQKDGRFYELQLPEGYTSKPYLIYWVKKNGTLHEIANMNRMEKMFSKQKNLFREFVREKKIKFDEPLEVQALVNYLDSLKI